MSVARMITRKEIMKNIIIELEPAMAVEFKMYLNFVYAQNKDQIMSVENVIKQIEDATR